jgi:hypothetical protein
MTQVVSVDIGSTWTKGALFDVDPQHPRTLRRGAVPTTTDNLATGFARLCGRLLQLPEDLPLDALPTDIPCYFSSSAKGGLAIAAVCSTDQREQGIILGDRQQRAIAKCPSHRGKVKPGHTNLSNEGCAHSAPFEKIKITDPNGLIRLLHPVINRFIQKAGRIHAHRHEKYLQVADLIVPQLVDMLFQPRIRRAAENDRESSELVSGAQVGYLHQFQCRPAEWLALQRKAGMQVAAET